MPIYEYKCDNCGNVFEAVQKFADPYLTVHEACGGGPVHRLLSVPSLQFKGTGFYITDYAKGSGAGPASNGGNKKGEASASSEGSASSGKGESKSSSDSSSSESKSAPAATANTSSPPSDKK